VAESTPTKYKYNLEFQLKVLALAVQEPRFLSMYHDTIKPEFFEKESHQILCGLLLDHATKYKKSPEKAIFQAELEDYIRKIPTQRSDLMRSLREESGEIYTLEIGDIPAIKDRAIIFGKRQALKTSVLKTISLLETDENYEQARGYIEKALSVGAGSESVKDFADIAMSLPEEVRNSLIYSRKIPTYIPEMDRRLGGGVGIGELAIIIGPPGRGKSTFLVNMGGAAILAGYPVLHISFELKQIDILLKYASYFTGCTSQDIMNGSREYFEGIKNLIQREMLKIDYFPPHSMTATGLRSYVNRLTSRGEFKPQLLIIDYPDRMRLGMDLYRDIGILYDEIIHLADDHKFAVWGASQAGRGAVKDGVTSEDDVSDSWQKIGNADIIATFSQSKEERFHMPQPLCRVVMTKVRRGEASYPILCEVDYAHCKIKQCSL